jgi:anti-sigma B factor antagonist
MTWLTPSSSPLAIEMELADDAATLVITGELDLTTRPALASHLSTALQAGPRRLIFDLAGTSFLDCGSARLIVDTSQFLPDGGRPVIRHPGRAVRRVLELTGLDADCEIER